MIYSKLYLQQKNRVPLIIAGIFLFFLITSIFLTNFLNKSALPSRASNIRLTKLIIGNINSNSAKIFWRTEEKQTGWVIYGTEKNKLNQIGVDERDINEKKGEYKNHYVYLRNLNENTNYYFVLVNNNRIVTDLNNPYYFKTLSSSQELKNITLAYGKVINKNNLPENGAMVNLFYEKDHYLITLTKNSGEWVIPVGIFTSKKIPSKVNIEIISEEGEISSIVADIENINPLPVVVVIGKNYNFTNSQKNVLGEKNGVKNSLAEVTILYPKENAVIPGKVPLIKGTALPKTEILLFIKGKKFYSASLKSDQDGFWNYQLPLSLPLGSYEMEVRTKDKENKEISLKRKFTLVGETGSSVLGEATPSANLTPTSIPTITTPTPTASYPLETSPTITTPTPTASYPLETFTPTPSYPQTGNNFLNLLYPSLAFILLGLGILAVF
ncbi:MAG: fibronectin type III domain-containing protein [Microgenomates group bacterium]